MAEMRPLYVKVEVDRDRLRTLTEALDDARTKMDEMKDAVDKVRLAMSDLTLAARADD